MAVVLKFKTFPEILSDAFIGVRALLGPTLALIPAQFLRTILEVCSLADAEQYVQIARLLDLFALDACKGSDIDRRARDFGSDFFTDLQRRKPNTSISNVTVSDGTVLKSSLLASATTKGAGSFTVESGDGASFPAAGSVVLESGTAREERVVYTRSGDTFTAIAPAAMAYAHALNGSVLSIAVESYLASGVAIGAGSVTLAAGSGVAWPATGNVILDRSNGNRELLAFTRSGDVLTVSATTAFAHAANASAILSTNGSDRSIGVGLTCYAPATLANQQVTFRISGAGPYWLLDGDYTSDLVPVESTAVGASTCVAANTITKWSSPPFTSATVTNPISATRGSDREQDTPYKARIRAFIQSLTRATPLAIETLVTGLLDDVSNQQVAFAQVVEPIAPGLSYLYITDGTPTFTLDQSIFSGRDVLIRDATAGDRRGRLSQYGPFLKVANPTSERTPRLFKSGLSGAATSVGANYLEDSSLSMAVNAYVGQLLKTDDNRFFAITANSAIRFTLSASGATPPNGSYAVFNFAVDPLVPDVDYTFNEANGDFEMATALGQHDAVVAADDGNTPVGAYSYSNGLAQYVQRKVNGDRTDFSNFPGIRASGTKVLVVAPTVVSPTFVLQVVPVSGVSDDEALQLQVQTVVEGYVNSLGIGETIILSEIIRLVKALPGVYDVRILSPSSNVPVPAGQLARITDQNVQTE